MFEVCVTAWGWLCSRNILFVFPLLSLRERDCTKLFSILMCRLFYLLKLHLSHPQPLNFKGSKEVTHSSHPLKCLCTQG